MNLPKLKPSKYELGYKLSNQARDDIHDDYKRWARQVGHRKINKDRFQWRPPRRCHGGLHCVYETLDEGSEKGVAPLAQLFRKRAEELANQPPTPAPENSPSAKDPKGE